MKHLNEYREYEKPKSNSSKLLEVSKIEIMDICQKLNLNTSDIKYIGSGSYGNAYKVGNKVVKITTHKDEAKSIFDLIKKNIETDNIVKYYSVNIYFDYSRLIDVRKFDALIYLNKSNEALRF